MQKLNQRDWLLIFGLVLAPMTGLRVWKIGPAEALCLFWGIKHFPGRYIQINPLLKFFVVYLGAMFIGTVIGYMIVPNEMSRDGYFVWLYLAIVSLSMYEGLMKNEPQYNEMILNLFSTASAIWYAFLYVYSIIVSRYFFSAPLWYGKGRFSGGGTNPHQLAVLMCGIIFVFTRNIMQKKQVLFNFLLLSVSLFILFKTASSTGILAIACSFLFMFFLLMTMNEENEKKKIGIILVECIAVSIVLIIGYRFFSSSFMNWIASDSNGYGRLEIFSSFPETFAKSPVFGLGTGCHAHIGSSGLMEFHNTYLEVLAASGIVGFVALAVFTIRVFKTISAEILYTPIIISIYTYGFAGFAMRRLVYWGIIVLVYVICKQKKEESFLENAQKN